MTGTVATVGHSAIGQPMTGGQRAAFDRDGFLLLPGGCATATGSSVPAGRQREVGRAGRWLMP
jgi:hypothetical protein